EEDEIAWNLEDPSGVGSAGEDVEAVETSADSRVIRSPGGSSSITVVVDVRSPGKSLIGDPGVVLGCDSPEQVELLGELGAVLDRVRTDVGADQDEIDAEAPHEVELAAGALDVGRK